MAKKVAEINDGGIHYIVVKDDKNKFNPYIVKHKWYDAGWHTKTIVKYSDLKSAMFYLASIL